MEGRELLDVVVVGGGQAGLAIGYLLQEAKRGCVILERGRVGETWRTQRWDSFVFNTPNWLSTLPGAPYVGQQQDGFLTRDEWVAYLEDYAGKLAIEVRTGYEVLSVTRSPRDGGFLVKGAVGSSQPFELESRVVVAASGILNVPNLPPLSRDMPAGPLQIHAAEYRSPDTLPAGSVLVVGTGQSGCQIAEDLLAAGRSVYLSASRVGRLPRRYRGRDIMEWLGDTGFWDVALDDLEDPSLARAAQPQISGIGRRGHSVSLQQLAGDGAVLLGRLTGVEKGVLVTDGRLAEYVTFADEFSAGVKADIDEFIAASGTEAPPAEDDPADRPHPGPIPGSLDTLDLAEAGVGVVIWCTGFTADFGWLRLPVFDEAGSLLHRRGVSPVPGIYFLGFPWLHTRKSGVIHGLHEDAEYIARSIEAHLG